VRYWPTEKFGDISIEQRLGRVPVARWWCHGGEASWDETDFPLGGPLPPFNQGQPHYRDDRDERLRRNHGITKTKRWMVTQGGDDLERGNARESGGGNDIGERNGVWME